MQRHNHNSKMSTGRMWVNLLSRILSHLTIIIAGVFVVLLACDFFLKGEMSFIANSYSKILLLALCIIAGLNSFIQLSCLEKLRSIRRYMKLKARQKDNF